MTKVNIKEAEVKKFYTTINVEGNNHNDRLEIQMKEKGLSINAMVDGAGDTFDIEYNYFLDLIPKKYILKKYKEYIEKSV